MNASPTTRSSLLLRIRDHEDQPAWNEFVEIYAPLIHAYGRHRGLQDADAADLAQDVLQAVLGACRKFEYDPARGSFRGWLFTITRNKLLNLVAQRKRQAPAGGGTAVRQMLEQQPDDDPQEEFWNRRHKERLFEWAAERVRPQCEESTWRAFLLTAVEQRPAAETAAALGISVGAVYIAKSRVLARLKETIRTIEVEP